MNFLCLDSVNPESSPAPVKSPTGAGSTASSVKGPNATPSSASTNPARPDATGSTNQATAAGGGSTGGGKKHRPSKAEQRRARESAGEAARAKKGFECRRVCDYS